ncbi:snf2 family helicase [Grosmannia clavigera kw1407]|uniref:Snf2 family helicase n=1 Tax=Grosmannia clavigera (strain kw1407 / UAMH 11150) TaxID=655863 RepID=F0XCX3_GROCL|nr:snf2 family helicase [Grosmannia clavigera kw1407]EFX03815.1 snf2 family helicase [Grosmannia clavigera kw1407]
MARSRSESFSDDDLLIVSSQAVNSIPSSPPRQNAGLDNVIDITSSPAVALTPGARTAGDSGRSINAGTARPVFGRPTQMTPTAAARQRDSVLFNNNKNRPEHHRPQRITGPLAPKHADRKAAPKPLFSSLPNGNTSSYPVSSFYDKQQPKTTAAAHADVDFYVDPNKASEDLKALLEGGMEDDEEEEEEGGGGGEEGKSKESKAKKVVEGLEDGTIAGIKVKLLPHQVEGVQWMKGRELGPVKRGRVPKGGILADDMGLGKTLQAISLIMTNSRPERDGPGWKKSYERVEKSTLVVAPLALIRQWEAEIKDKVSGGRRLKVCVHHGPQRTTRASDLAEFDVVITTYQILVSEHGHSSEALKSGCFGVNWYRVILDEAHSIKNRNAKATKACCALSAEFRWCLTGTPMQNNLDELQSLVNFLRITPYDNLAEWRAHIDHPLKNGRGYLAIRRLHSLLRCFMKRRTKEILKEEGALVPGGKKALDAAAASSETPTSGFKITERNVVEVSTEFSVAERRFYDQLEERADKSLEKMMKGSAMSYANALVLLLRLRQACNHPDLLKQQLSRDKDALSTEPAPKASSAGGDMDDLADALGGLGIQAKRCEVCMAELSRAEQTACVPGDELVCSGCLADRSDRKDRSKKDKAKNGDDEALVRAVRKPRNRRAIIDSDDEDEEEDGSWLVGEEQRGSLRLGKAGGSEDEDAEGGGDWIESDDSIHHSEDEDDGSRLSSFIVDDESGSSDESETEIGSDSENEHKFIVFSQFTSMLDLLGPFLERAGLGHVQYDGRMRNDAREASLRSLREDAATRVLLCSLKCGALGLNLTAATRVVILEPFWNPFVEEQAIDRVHRLTQTVDVTVYKLTIADTVEQRILELQAKKRLLAAHALEESAGGSRGGRGGKGVNKKEALKLGLKELMDLFRHDARGQPGDPDDVPGMAGPLEPVVDGGLLRRRDPGSKPAGKTAAVDKLPQNSAYSRRW